eukprot:maker-scaffold_6-snap-gene-3.48-mRNA-1 protein AED:0.46 eAED:0.46 QI:61/1/1/1/1/1/2/35/64
MPGQNLPVAVVTTLCVSLIGYTQLAAQQIFRGERKPVMVDSFDLAMFRRDKHLKELELAEKSAA